MTMPSGVPDDRGLEPGGYPTPRTDLPPRPPAPGARVGRAVGVEVRQESQPASSNAHLSLTVLAFRLLEPGNPQPLDVMLRGRSLQGTVRDGDWIEVAGPPDATGRWNLSWVQNITTGARVLVVGGRPSRVAQVLLLGFLGLVLLVFGLIVVGILYSLA